MATKLPLAFPPSPLNPAISTLCQVLYPPPPSSVAPPVASLTEVGGRSDLGSDEEEERDAAMASEMMQRVQMLGEEEDEEQRRNSTGKSLREVMYPEPRDHPRRLVDPAPPKPKRRNGCKTRRFKHPQGPSADGSRSPAPSVMPGRRSSSCGGSGGDDAGGAPRSRDGSLGELLLAAGASFPSADGTARPISARKRSNIREILRLGGKVVFCGGDLLPDEEEEDHRPLVSRNADSEPCTRELGTSEIISTQNPSPLEQDRGGNEAENPLPSQPQEEESNATTPVGTPIATILSSLQSNGGFLTMPKETSSASSSSLAIITAHEELRPDSLLSSESTTVNEEHIHSLGPVETLDVIEECSMDLYPPPQPLASLVAAEQCSQDCIPERVHRPGPSSALSRSIHPLSRHSRSRSFTGSVQLNTLLAESPRHGWAESDFRDAETVSRGSFLQTGPVAMTGASTAPHTPSRVSLMSLLLDRSDDSFPIANMHRVGRIEQGEDASHGGVDPYCCVCMIGKKGAAFIPCGHTFCRKCSRELWRGRGACPLCNHAIFQILDIY